MIIFTLNDDLIKAASEKKLVVDDYRLDKTKTQLTVEVEDVDTGKFFRFVLKDMEMTPEIFDIKGKYLEDVLIFRHVQFFKNGYFQTFQMTIVDDNGNKIIFSGKDN